MNTYMNPKYTQVSIEDDKKEHRWIGLSKSPDDLMLGNHVHIGDGEEITGIILPRDCNEEAELLINSGAKLNIFSVGDRLPYDEIMASYEQLNRQFVVGRATSGQIYVHMKLPDGTGLIAAV